MRRSIPCAATLGAALVATLWAGAQPGGPLPRPFPLFPASHWWNTDISAAPVDSRSASFIAFINNGGTRRLHPDLGGDAGDGSIYGFPYVVVDGTQPKKAVEFLYGDESDGVDHSTGASFPFYPIPDEAISQTGWIEGGPPGNVDLRDENDRHLLIVDRDNRYLYELYNVFYDGTRWHAGSGAFFDLNRSDRRPDGWTSADAAGLAMLPGLIRYDEVVGPDEIGHAFRVTLRATNGYVYPASHTAGSNPSALPMGARLRLKAGVDLSPYPAEAQKIFRAMKKYGLIVADNGTDMYISGTYDVRWNNDVLNPAFAGLKASDFEVVQLGWIPPPPASPVVGAATIVSATGFTANWGSASGAAGYRLDVASDGAFAGFVAGYRDLDVGNATTWRVGGLSVDSPYFYRVRAYGAGGASGNSGTMAVATLALPAFTDDPIVPRATTVKAAHVNELRQRVTELRARYGVAAPSWTTSAPLGGVTPIRSADLTDLRTALAAVYTAAGRTPPAWSPPSILAGTTVVSAAHIAELRIAILAIW